MTQYLITANAATGRYAVRCSCGFIWDGVGECYLSGGYSPTLPMAEIVHHQHSTHVDEKIDVEFEQGFSAWLAEWFDRYQRDYPTSHHRAVRR